MAEDGPTAESTLSAELSGLSLLEKTSDSALDRRINESLKRLTLQLDKAKEHQLEGKRLFKEIEEIEKNKTLVEHDEPVQPVQPVQEQPVEQPSHDDVHDAHGESPQVKEHVSSSSSCEATPEIKAEAVPTPPLKSSEAEDTTPLEQPLTPPVKQERRASIRSPTTSDIVTITAPVKLHSKEPSKQRSRTSSANGKTSSRRSSSSSRYSDVLPRYMQPLRPTSFLRSEKPVVDPFLSQHAKMNAAFGYHKVQPRLYEERKEVKKPKEAPPKKPKDAVLTQHRILTGRLGYNKVKSRLFDNTYGLSDVEGSIQVPTAFEAQSQRRSSTPVIRGRSPSLTRAATPRRSSTPVVVATGGAPFSDHKSPLKVRPKRLRSCTPAARKAAEGSACWEEVESLLKLASTNEKEGDYDAAEKLHLEVLKIRRKVLGGNHVTILSSLTGLSMLTEKAQKWVACEMYCKEAIQATDRLMPDQVKKTKLQVRLGASLVQLTKYKEAETYLRDLLARAQVMYPTDHTVTCTVRYWLAQAVDALGMESEAAELQKLNIALGYANPSSARASRGMTRSASVQSHNTAKRRLSV